MEKNLFKFIWKYSKRQQVIIVLITVLSFPILYVSLELPKRIINEAIGGNTFPKTFLGMEFQQIPYLLALCFAFLGLVVANNVIKYMLNTYKGLTGERMLRRLRYQLYERVLRFRLPHFGRISSGEIIPMITAEVEPVGGFISDAISIPAFQGGTLVVYIVFIFVQDPLLGAAAVALYPIQGYIIPRLQRKVNQLGKQRVRNIRQMSDRIGESIGGIREIHANDTAAFHLADISDRLQTNFEIRFDIFKRKFGIKFLNNFLNQLTPFFFYSIGGYLVIQGNISFGALVAVLAAYKDLAGPWKELLAYYQQLADVQVKYDAVVEQFDPPDIYPVERLDEIDGFSISAGDQIVLQNAAFVGAGSGQNVEAASATIPLSGTTAIIGGEGSGRTQLVQMIAGLLAPSSGRVTMAGREVDELPAAVLGRQFGYIDPTPYVFTGTIRSNLVYGLAHRPLEPLDPEDLNTEELEYRLSEAKITGARGYEIRKRWEDYEAAGAATPEQLDETMVHLVTRVGLGEDVYRMGLQSSAEMHDGDGVSERILAARAAIRDRVTSEPEFGDYVHLWDVDSYNLSASVVENMLFGLPVKNEMTPQALAAVPQIVASIRDAGLHDDLVGVGRRIAETMVELFADISEENDLLSTYSFIPRDEIPEYDAILNRSGKKGAMSDEDKTRLLGLAFMLVPTRHRLGLLTDEIKDKIVAMRGRLRETLDRDMPGQFEFFDEDRLVSSLSIEDNLLFGRPRLDRPKARQSIERFIGEIVDQTGLRDVIMRAGLAFEVGVAGSRLSTGQKQRVALVRMVLRRPAVVFADGLISGTGSNDPVLSFLKETLPDSAIICGMARSDMAGSFDHVIVMREGHLVAEGTPDAVADALSPLRVAAE
ncbi:MAG: ATP-binding cassette domain-containing protein [Rhodobiaceae bacterium]|nr:ATP-binding cassette domain-containing protein [Rhodobiaceae bacterium]